MTRRVAQAPLFFYGTLCHIPLLEIVLGRPAAQIEIAAGHLTDHAASWVKDAAFPMIAAVPGAVAQGLVVRALSETDIARLAFYEGGFSYDLAQVNVMTGAGGVDAQVFFPRPGLFEPGAPWDLNTWVARWGALSCAAAREVMRHFGRKSADEIAQLLPYFRARGWAQQLAKTAVPYTLRRDMPAGAVTLDPKDTGHAGFFRLDEFAISYPRFDGTQSDTIERGSFVAYDAALLLPYDPVADRILLIEQLRFGPLLRGDEYPWVLEPIAGLVDAGEPPIEAARREAVEEAGLHVSDIRPIGEVYASPGYSTEFFHMFLGLCDLSSVSGGLGGLADENEDIRSHVMTFDQAMALLDSGEINQSPLAMMLLWLFRARIALRSEVSDQQS